MSQIQITCDTPDSQIYYSINNEDYYRINMVLEKLDSEGVEFI